MISHCELHATNKSSDFTVVSIIWPWNMVGNYSPGRQRIAGPHSPREIKVSKRIECSIFIDVGILEKRIARSRKVMNDLVCLPSSFETFLTTEEGTGDA